MQLGTKKKNHFPRRLQLFAVRAEQLVLNCLCSQLNFSLVLNGVLLCKVVPISVDYWKYSSCLSFGFPDSSCHVTDTFCITHSMPHTDLLGYSFHGSHRLPTWGWLTSPLLADTESKNISVLLIFSPFLLFISFHLFWADHSASASFSSRIPQTWFCSLFSLVSWS